jgi:hypothetical protein
MPDLDLLPPGHALSAAPRPPAGLADVLSRATRRRRRQQAGALATGAAACAAVLAFTMATGGAVDSLGVTPATQSGHGVLPMDTPRVAGPDLPAAAVLERSTGSVDGQGAQGSGAQPAAAQTRQEKASAAAAKAQKASGGEVGPPHSVTAYDPSRGCNGDGSLPTQGWCGYYDGATTGRGGAHVELAETMCRLPGQGAGTLQADDGEQASFSARSQDGTTGWHWGNGRRFSPTGTTFNVAAGSCLRWHVSWSVVDDAGRRLAPGTYTLEARPHAYPPGSTRVTTYTGILRFQVT